MILEETTKVLGDIVSALASSEACKKKGKKSLRFRKRKKMAFEDFDQMSELVGRLRGSLLTDVSAKKIEGLKSRCMSEGRIKKMTTKEAYEKLKKTRQLSTAMLEPLGISFNNFLKYGQLSSAVADNLLDRWLDYIATKHGFKK